jgi:uncharacterized membrane protein
LGPPQIGAVIDYDDRGLPCSSGAALTWHHRPVSTTPEDTTPEDTGREDDEAGAPPGVERLLALSDGVVAIALTLLVLQITVPATSSLRDPHSAADLAAALDAHYGEWISYAISFYVVIQFWLLHHRLFKRIVRQQDGLVLWNAAFLFAVSVMPFTSDLLGKDASNPLSVAIFGLNLLLANLAMVGLHEFAWRRNLMRESGGDRGEFRRGSAAGVLVVLLSLAVAWVNTTAAELCWLLFGAVPQIAAALDRGWSRLRGGGGSRSAGR